MVAISSRRHEKSLLPFVSISKVAARRIAGSTIRKPRLIILRYAGYRQADECVAELSPTAWKHIISVSTKPAAGHESDNINIGWFIMPD
ncbi:MAG TPA: hypothetical protein PK677_17435 [Acidiphilium sp.]|jgi:hypothetical protein|nr:hypothetical protein [Acidiphilium sp.]HQT90287.1 hypothetical protein [Acidiphilium sp.]HQU25115.1 hypothetical protein [Acidiphilium sp.]